MPSRRVDPTRAAGVSLVLFAALTFAAPFLPSHADLDATSPAADVAGFFRDDNQLQTLQAWLHAGPSLLLLAAVILLFARLRAAGPHGPALAVAALAAATALAALSSAAFVAIVSAMRGANEGFDPHLALFLYNVAWSVMAFTPAFLAPVLIASVGFLAPAAGLPGWLRPVSLVSAAILGVVVLAAALPVGGGALFAGLVLLLVWSLVFGIVLLVRPHAARSTPT